MDEIAGALVKCELFSGFSESGFGAFLETLCYEIQEYRRGDVIIRMDQPYPCISVIIDGTIEIHRPLSVGNSLFIEHRSEGGLIGGATVFSPAGTPARCGVIAKTRVRLLRITADEVRKMLGENPVLSSRLNEIFAGRVLALQGRLELLSYSSIKRKIACYCLNRMGGGGDSVLVLPFSKSKWAEYMNISRPSLMRELKSLETGGILGIDDAVIRILDREGLEEYL